ncbi:MAG TPA: hypothetical protein RMG95_03500 [Polyangiaceae bacterium LLY-WYZ-15_(1-7)]|nr:hypothetical protein [Polyangiaceae bacterium LLY-WYZ-15_(1-7)]HJL23879.1 hypothetical protein [Polyangiaceae bacterium LLY-WYZ-15_(1-7)]HJL33126.1 hypothetical protein [Polyangiaceae bacterium LLY-WYZ-15_(1-7)]HJL34746.1 hypothetical protein [Polyangiaceae bacterium LLY-WYZ-15_(1-7)]HJL46768.1 hypothetical protein [Polyangiaceae bacterium LLY-WYZ-15_(1-7)]
MASHLSEMENEALIVIGRPVKTEFESVEQIEAAASAADELARKLKLPLGLVYCGTTINWPDDFEYTPCLVGLVTHVYYGDDEAEPGPLPAAAMAERTIPDEFWAAMKELGLELEGETGTYLAVAGWTWADISGPDGERIVGVSAEDDGYTRLDGNDAVMKGEGLTIRASYC